MDEQIQDYSPAALFLQADPVVKAVVLLLVLASIAVWTVVIDRGVRLARQVRNAASPSPAAPTVSPPPAVPVPALVPVPVPPRPAAARASAQRRAALLGASR
jgi:hypothetical protein